MRPYSMPRLINANNWSYIAAPKLKIMEYNRIVAVTGMPGLYEVVTSKTDGALVRSLEDKSTKFISSRVHNMSHLESIEVYTVRDNVQLSDLFEAMKSNGAALPDVKDNKAVKSYFETVYPDLDFERVYVSDMKKMVKWFDIIKTLDIDFSSPEETTEEEEVSPEAETVTAEETAPEKKASKPKKPKAEAKTEEAGSEEKPKKTRKKKED
jgi:cell division septation protein DedD